MVRQAFLVYIHFKLICLELSIAPALNHRLVPPHVRASLASRGLDIDNFTPMPEGEMIARLD